jgi:hypothetical protein
MSKPRKTGAPEIEITPSMIEAGVYAAKECCFGEGLETLVFRIFLAMRTEELDAERPGLIDKPGQIGNEEAADS